MPDHGKHERIWRDLVYTVHLCVRVDVCVCAQYPRRQRQRNTHIYNAGGGAVYTIDVAEEDALVVARTPPIHPYLFFVGVAMTGEAEWDGGAPVPREQCSTRGSALAVNSGWLRDLRRTCCAVAYSFIVKYSFLIL